MQIIPFVLVAGFSALIIAVITLLITATLRLIIDIWKGD